jgi:uncharacterized membrane protein YqjE
MATMKACQPVACSSCHEDEMRFKVRVALIAWLYVMEIGLGCLWCVVHWLHWLYVMANVLGCLWSVQWIHHEGLPACGLQQLPRGRDALQGAVCIGCVVVCVGRRA